VHIWDDFVEVLGATNILACFEKFMKSRFTGTGKSAIKLLFIFHVRRENISKLFVDIQTCSNKQYVFLTGAALIKRIHCNQYPCVKYTVIGRCYTGVLFYRC